jgi:hypothetical protein
MVFPPVPSEALIKWEMRTKILPPFWKSVLMSTKGRRDSEKQKGYSVESTEVMTWRRYMDEVKKWDDSRLPLVGGYMRGMVAATV